MTFLPTKTLLKETYLSSSALGGRVEVLEDHGQALGQQVGHCGLARLSVGGGGD